MKLKFTRIDKFTTVLILVLVIGVISSFFDFGIASVFFSVTMPFIFVINLCLAIYGLIKKKYSYSIGVLIFFLCYNSFFQFNMGRGEKPNKYISLISYNVRSFKQPIDFELNSNAPTEIKKFIDSINPGVLLLQESGYVEEITIKGYPNVFLGYRNNLNKSPLAIYSKYPIIDKGYLDFPNTINDAIYADLKIEKDTIRVYNTHLQSFVFTPHILANNYDDYNYLNNLNNTITKQIEQAHIIKKHANKSNNKVIICGDFNATSYSQPYSILKKDLTDSYVNNGNGFGTTFRRLYYPLRIDYFLCDKQIEVLDHKNFSLKLSDHEPILIKFKIKY